MPSRRKDSDSASASARLDRERWIFAAQQALGRGGLRAVAVEPLAKSLGVTKGSFYWHFANRRALVDALLDAFETRATAEVVARVERVADPRARLVALIEEATDAATLGIEAALAASASAGTEPIASRYRQVSARRQAYLVHLYTQLGLPPTKPRSGARPPTPGFSGCSSA